MPASIAKNAQEGTRSEYLAQFLLSHFGTAIPVPHPEDSGIDLYCTLGRRVGRRFLVENQYLVQVKSNSEPISYIGSEEVQWLLSHKYPLFICIVSKQSASVEIYQTLSLATISAKQGFDNLYLHAKTNKTNEYFPQDIQSNDLNIYLGKPIVKFSAIQISNKDFSRACCETLRSWIELDQENIDIKSTGYTGYRIPEKWKTNEPVIALKLIGNFKDSFGSHAARIRFNDVFFKLLSCQQRSR